MTPDPMHIVLGGGCLVMTGLTLHLYRQLAEALPKARRYDRICQANTANGRKRHERERAKTMAMRAQLDAEAKACGDQRIQRSRIRWGL